MVHTADQSNTSIVFDTAYFLKIYRKVDRAMNADAEITQFLTDAKFNHIPAYIGSITWTNAGGSMVLGMMQEMVDNNLDGWTYMLDKLKNYYERIQVTAPDIKELSQPGNDNMCNVVDYENSPEEVKKLLEASVADKARLLGTRTAEMHLALASSDDLIDFAPEPFSLHYQRSLFSSFLSLVRKTFQNLEKNLNKLSPDVKAEAEETLGMKDKIMLRFRKIYHRKMDAVKIRVHGDYHLGQILFTGNDLVILDFEGEPAHSFGERRLKKSPLRDVAGMMRSLHYAAYGDLLLNSHTPDGDITKLTPFAEVWHHFMSGYYLKAYLETINDSSLIPKDTSDLEILLSTYTLEKAIYELNYELNNRPDWVIIPLRGIKAIMQKKNLINYDS
jgi:maltose alpha-D-glucosyltransferase/alpha-amylase